LHGGNAAPRLISYEFSDAEMLAALRVEKTVKDALRRDGLDLWLPET
jgi:hypothetical protein